jgi:hypothetical protein
MFISTVSVEKWEGTQNKGVLETVQTWAEIETAIKELDGHDKTLVTLESDGETHMAIGGGIDQYIVYVTFDNETFHYLVDLSKPDTNERLTVGGQEGIYPLKLCIGISTVLKAAKTFAELGKMDQSLTWEQDKVVEPV